MRTPATTFIENKNAKENKPVYLYTIYSYDGSNNLRFAGYDTDISFCGNTFSRSPITHDYTGQNASGEIDSVRLSLSNVSRTIQAYLEDNDFRGKQVDICLVFTDDLISGAEVKDTYYIDSYTADEDAVTFILRSRFDVLDVEIPKRKYYREHCPFVFKGTSCGYSGGAADCNRTLQRCRALSNENNFGGFPSIPDRNLYV